MNVLRVSCTKAAGLVKTVVQKPAFRGLATVAENTIKITFVDQEVRCYRIYYCLSLFAQLKIIVFSFYIG